MTKTFCGITKKRDAFLHPIFINLKLPMDRLSQFTEPNHS